MELVSLVYMRWMSFGLVLSFPNELMDQYLLETFLILTHFNDLFFLVTQWSEHSDGFSDK